MFRKSLLLLLLGASTGSVYAESIVDCRVITGGTTECNPYSSRLIRAKTVDYDVDKQKLIVTKTLPVPAKRPKLKVVSVADMIEKYVKVAPSMRYSGSQESAVSVYVPKRKQPVPEKELASEEKETKEVMPAKEAEKQQRGYYTIVRGDTLSTIAAKYGLKTKELRALNQLGKDAPIRIGKKLLVPFPQDTVDAIATGSYKVQSGDTLISISRKFNLDPKKVAAFNSLKSTALLREGKVIKLPLPYIVKAIAAKKKAQAAEKKLANALKKRKKGGKFIRAFGKHKLRVTATAYSSHHGQTDKTPFLAAWNNRIRPGMKIIAVSRDLLYKYGLRNGSRVRISGLPGIYRVRDKMNKRYRKRIDIYMGVNRRKALRWGRRSVILYW